MRALLLIAGIVSLLVAAPAHAQLPLPTPPEEEEPPAPGPPPPVLEPAAPGSTWATFGGDAAHRFATGDPTIAPPFGLRWAVDRETYVGSPLIADGRVFISRSRPDTSNGAIVESLDARTGAVQWSKDLAGESFTVEMSYEGGRLYVVERSGGVVALDVRTGDEGWRTTVDEPGGDSAPVPAADTIYIQGNGTITALDQATGQERWIARIGDGTDGDPAVVGDRIYVKAACTVLALDRRDGRTLWSHDRGCGGGGGDTVLLWRDLVFPFGDEHIGPRRAEDGAAVAAPRIEVVGGDIGLELDDFAVRPQMRAYDLVAGQQLWQEKREDTTIVLTGHVLGLSDDEVVVRDLGTGTERWGALLNGTTPSGPGYGGSRPGPAAGEGIVVLPVGGRVVALDPAAAPVPVTIELTERPDVSTGTSFVVRGATGTAVAARRTTLEASTHPYRRGFRPAVSGATNLAGDFHHGFIARRNTRLRVSTDDGRVSKSVQVFAYARLRPRYVQRGGVVLGRLLVGAPRDIPLGGRRVAVYLGRRGSRRLRLLDAARLSGRRARFIFRALPPRRARGALLYTCLRGAHRLGLGRPDVLSRRCGRRVIRF